MKLDRNNKLLLLGLVLFLFFCYKFAISKTILAKRDSEKLSSEKALFSNIPKQLSILKQKEIFYDSILRRMNLGNTSVQNNLLRIINLEAKEQNVSVIDFNQPHVYKRGENTFNTLSFKLQGTFSGILTVMHIIEQKGNFGEIVHVSYEKEKNYKTNKSILLATVFIQHVE